MKIQGVIKAAIDKLHDIAQSPDYPQFTPKAFLAWAVETFPFFPGIASGSFAASGAAMTVGPETTDDVQDTSLEFDPAVVLIANETTGCLFLSVVSPAGKAWKLKAADNTIAFVAADALTLGTRQFTVGVEGDLNNAADQIRYVALGV